MTYEPQEVDNLTMAFPTNISHLMPSMEEIPEEFKSYHNPWCKLFSEWFYKGISQSKLVAKESIDREKALRHIGTIMGSFEPKHEHKEATVAYLLSLWFERGD